MRPAIGLLAVVTVALLAGPASAAAQSQRSAAAPAQMIVGPGEDRLIKRLPVRVAVRVPARTYRLRILLGRRDVTSRFRAMGGSRRVADLTRGDGLRYGSNRLVVRAERRGGRPAIHARSLVLVQRRDDLVSLRIRQGSVTSLDARVAAPGALATIRRSRTVRLWVNGRPASRALDRSGLTRFTAKLSAAHGLRYGVNRLRLLVAEPDPGRYQVVRRRFVVKRTRHLAAAGWDVQTRAGRVQRLDGRRSRTTNGGQPRHRWTIVSKPRGSRAGLRRAGSARPVLTPDSPGRYVVRLELAERSARAGASQAAPLSTDQVEVVAAPAPLQPFKGLTTQNGKHGIQVGSTFYPNPSPNGAALQWLTLDRKTLTLAKAADNSWLDGTGSGANGIQTLAAALKGQGLNQLVILSYPYGGSAPPVQQGQNDAFNAAVKLIGVGPIDAGILQDRNKLAIVGTPGGGDGSGWYTHGGGNVDGLTGWLMPDRIDGFRFQPAQTTFATSATGSTATSNTMSLAGQQVSDALPAGATGGFQVTTLDPIDFTVSAHAVFATNGVANPVAGIDAMTAFVSRNNNGPHVVVQSIGRVALPPPPSDPYQPDRGKQAWTRLGQALSVSGANPHTFIGVNGAYAFVGGSWLERSEVAESSSAIVTDPTTSPPETEPGTLSGRLSIRSDGYYVPTPSAETDTLDSLYDMTFTAPEPWPQTSGPEAAAYQSALAYITSCLVQTKDWGRDLRQAYAGDLNRDWATAKTDLGRVLYPGDGPCPSGSKWSGGTPDFSRAQFERLSAELQTEFEWLNGVKKLFDAYEKAVTRSNAKGSADLNTLGAAIHNDVDPPNDDLTADIGNFLLELAEIGIDIATEGAESAVKVIVEGLAAAYELGMSLSADERSGAPLGREVDTKVGELSQQAADRLDAAVTSLDSVHQVVASDYGRLKALGTAAESPEWAINVDLLASSLTVSANAWFSNEIFPVGYRIWYLNPSFSWSDIRPNDCYLFGYGRSWRDADTSSWVVWDMPFEGQNTNRGGSLLALSKRSWSARQDAFPSKDLTNRTFGPMSQRGYGVSFPDFVWERFKAPYPYVNCYR